MVTDNATYATKTQTICMYAYACIKNVPAMVNQIIHIVIIIYYVSVQLVTYCTVTVAIITDILIDFIAK